VTDVQFPRPNHIFEMGEPTRHFSFRASMDIDEYWCLRAPVSASGGSVQGHVTSVDLGGNERRSVGGGTSQRAVPVPSRFSDSPSVGSCRDSLHGSMEDVGGVRVVTGCRRPRGTDANTATRHKASD